MDLSIRGLTDTVEDVVAGRELVREYVIFTHEEALQHGVPGMPADLAAFAHLIPDVDDFAAHYVVPGAQYLVAERKGTIVGGVGIVDHDVRTSVMKRLWVREEGRGSGAGRALALAAIAGARSLGYDRVVLDVAPYRTHALALYRSLGFGPHPPIAEYPFEMTTLQADITGE